MADEIQQHSWQEHFSIYAQRLWEGLVTQIKHDVAQVNAGIKPKNATGLPTMEGKIEINGRELMPGPYELHVDKPIAPARKDGYFERPMWLTIQLDIDAESLRIIRRDTPDTRARINSDGWDLNVKTINIIQLNLVDKEVRIEQFIEKLSGSIVSTFLPYPARKCGTRRKRNPG